MQRLFARVRRRNLTAPQATTQGTSHADDHERLLLRRIAAHDPHAFEALYRQYAPRLHRYLAKLIARQDVVEEVLDDVMVVVWQNAARFDGTSKPSTWILGIAYHKALKARAKGKREPLEPPPAPTGHHTDTPEALLKYAGLQRELARALDHLSPEQRTVVELTFHEELSYQEIAQIMDCPVNTVKTRMWHARQYLKTALASLHATRSAPKQTPSVTP